MITAKEARSLVVKWDKERESRVPEFLETAHILISEQAAKGWQCIDLPCKDSLIGKKVAEELKKLGYTAHWVIHPALQVEIGWAYKSWERIK